MKWPVTIRDTESIETILADGKDLTVPLEVAYNSIILMKTMDDAEKVIPSLKELEPDDWIKLNAAAAYFLRTDLIRDGVNSMTIVPLYRGRLSYNWPYGEYFKVNPLNDPKDLHEGWEPSWQAASSEILKRPRSRSIEFFRCYSHSISCNPKLKKDIVDEKKSVASVLGDIAAFLVNPQDLVDYTYTSEEIRDYNRRLLLSIRDF